jgi:hypothetical protein
VRLTSRNANHRLVVASRLIALLRGLPRPGRGLDPDTDVNLAGTASPRRRRTSAIVAGVAAGATPWNQTNRCGRALLISDWTAAAGNGSHMLDPEIPQPDAEARGDIHIVDQPVSQIAPGTNPWTRGVLQEIGFGMRTLSLTSWRARDPECDLNTRRHSPSDAIARLRIPQSPCGRRCVGTTPGYRRSRRIPRQRRSKQRHREWPTTRATTPPINHMAASQSDEMKCDADLPANLANESPRRFPGKGLASMPAHRLPYLTPRAPSRSAVMARRLDGAASCEDGVGRCGTAGHRDL